MPDCDGHEQDPQVPRPGLKIDLEAIDLDREGRGLARLNSWVVVVPDLLPGERARVQLQQRQKSQWLSRRLELQDISPERRSSPCILAKDCGGCTLQHWQDQAQASWKRRNTRADPATCRGSGPRARNCSGGSRPLPRISQQGPDPFASGSGWPASDGLLPPWQPSDRQPESLPSS